MKKPVLCARIFPAAALALLATGCVMPVSTDPVAVRPAFLDYRKVAICSNRFDRPLEEIFIPLYMEAFPYQALVERRDLESIIGEQDILPDRLNECTRARIREILGVEAIIFPNRSPNQLAIKVIDTQTGEIVASAVCARTLVYETRDSYLVTQTVKALRKKAYAMY